MAITNFNAKNGLSVGTGSINVIDSSGNATFATAMTTGSLGVGTNYSSTTRFFASGSSIGTDPVVVVKAGVLLPTGALFDIQDSQGSSLFVVSGSGRVGIGTSASLSSTLTVNGSLYATIFSGSAFSGSLTKLTDGTSYLIAGSGITITTASNGSVTIAGQTGDITSVTAGVGLLGGGSSGDVSLSINDSVVATVSGSTFIGATKHNAGLTGSLTKLIDGTSYLVAGPGISIISQSNGSILITGSSQVALGGSSTYVQFNDGGVFGGDANFTFNKNTDTLTVSNISGSLTKLSDGSSYLIAGSGITITTGSNGSVTVSGQVGDITSVTAGTGLTGGGSSGDVTLNINDSIVATVSGTTFTGVTKHNAGLSGSLTKLTDGTSYLIAGSGISVTTGSLGAVTITSTVAGTSFVAGSDTQVQFNDGGSFGANSGLTYNKTTQALTSSIFRATSGFSGSLTKLTDGTSYLIAGSGVTITTGSNGSVTISGQVGDITSVAAGTGLTGGGTSGDVTLNINDSIVATVSGTTFTGVTKHSAGLSGSLTKLTDGTSYLIAGSGIFITSQSNGSVLITGSLPGGSNTYVQFNDGGSFGGDVNFTFNKSTDTLAVTNISGSLTRLTDGTSYLIAGSGVTITTGSSGAITISGQVGDITGVTAGNGLSGGGSSGDVTLAINDSIVATVSGTTFTGITKHSAGLSGSLTKLTDGTSYLIAGTGISVTTGSAGAVTITSTVAGTSFVAGSDTQVQFNDGGTFGAAAGFTFTKSTNLLKVPNISGSLTGSNVVAGQVVITGTGGVLSGSNLLYWDNTNGRLGVGTTSPIGKFSVGSGNQSVVLDSTGTGGLATIQSYNGILKINDLGNNTIFNTGGGTVGIGTTNPPASKFFVSGSGTLSDPVVILKAGVVSPTGGAGILDVQTSAGTSVMFVTSSSRVGVGTNLPQDSFHTIGSIKLGTNSGGGYLSFGDETSTNRYVGVYRSAGGTELSLGGYGSMVFQVSATNLGSQTERMRIDSSGNVGIGTTNPNGNRLAITGGNLSVTGSVLPGVTVTYDLGSSTYSWRDVYARTGSFSGDVSISGNLTVAGTQTIVNSTTVEIKDNIILLNAGPSPLSTGGVYVADTVSNLTGSLIWDSVTDTWKAGKSGSETTLVSGSGTTNYITKWAGSNHVGTSVIYDNGTNVGIGTTLFSDKLAINGSLSVTGSALPGTSNTYDLGSSTKLWSTVFATNLTGSLTKLSNGTSYLVAGTGISITTGSTGAVTVTSTVAGTSFVAGSDTQVQFNDGGSFGASSNFTFSKTTNLLKVLNISGSLTGSNVSAGQVVITGTGGVLSGSNLLFWDNTNSRLGIGTSSPGDKLSINGSLSVTGSLLPGVTSTYDLGSSSKLWSTVYATNLTGSLTRLSNGTSYLIAGNNVTIATGSTGAITISTTGLASLAAAYLTVGNDATLTNERSLTTGIGLTASDGGANGAYTLAINDSIVATISGSTFTGVTKHNAGLSGSLTKLADGSSYLIAGPGISIVSQSNGSIFITGSSQVTLGGFDTYVQFNDGGVFGGNSNLTFNKTTGALKATTISGSLTRLVDGSPYLIAGSNITLSTGSNGSITINAAVLPYTTASFTNVTSLTINHSMGISLYDIEIFDTSYNKILPKSATATSSTQADITFGIPTSGYAIVGGPGGGGSGGGGGGSNSTPAYTTFTGSITLDQTSWTLISTGSNYMRTGNVTTTGGGMFVSANMTFYSTDPTTQFFFTAARSTDDGSSWTNVADGVNITTSTGKLQTISIGDVATNIIPINITYLDSTAIGNSGNYRYAIYYKSNSGTGSLGNGSETYALSAHEI